MKQERLGCTKHWGDNQGWVCELGKATSGGNIQNTKEWEWKMMILLGQIDKYVLVSLPLYNPIDLDLGPRLKCSRAFICREFPRRVSTSHPRFSFGHSFLLGACEFKGNFQHFVRITSLLRVEGNQLRKDRAEDTDGPSPLQTLIADFLQHKCIINQPCLPSTVPGCATHLPTCSSWAEGGSEVPWN